MNTPNTNDKLVLDEGVKKIDEQQYKSLNRGLIYLTYSRSDIMFNILCLQLVCYPNSCIALATSL